MAEADVAVAALDRDSGERFQSLRGALGVSSFGMNLIVLQPRQRGRVHAHEHQEEVYLVLEGELTLIVEGAERMLGPDELARVGPSARRQLVNAGSRRVVLLALGVAPVCVMLLIGFGAPPPTVAELLYAVHTSDGRS